MSEQPHVHVVRGAPDDVELAALVAGLVAASHGRSPAEDDVGAEADARRRWVAAGTVRRTGQVPRGRDAWRWSQHP